MIRDYFGMLVHEIELEEQAEAARASAIIASGQIAREQRHRDCVGKMKQFASWFTHGVPGGGALRKQIFESKNGDHVLDAIDRFFTTRAETAYSEHTRARAGRATPRRRLCLLRLSARLIQQSTLRLHLLQNLIQRPLEDQNLYLHHRLPTRRQRLLRIHMLTSKLRITPHITRRLRKTRNHPLAIAGDRCNHRLIDRP